MKDFKDKVAVITGAASGIGRGIAEHCLEEGMKVVLADIEEAPLIQTEEALKARNKNVLAVRTDVSKANDIEALAQKTLDQFGAVHLLFNNAGVEVRGTVWENTIADWEWIINVNLWGVIHGIRVFVPIMLRQETPCHIVNTASVAGLIAGAGMGPYHTTKAAIISLSETLYFELKQRNTQMEVSVLFPVFVRSRLVEAERNRPPELRNPTDKKPLSAHDRELLQWFKEQNQNGMSPAQFALRVFEGIQENRLYIMPQPERIDAIKQRIENILKSRNPTPQKRA
jgi:NAD(P)-dependent dehydrogenase (short-subunit alcohol dehydrogenase family)